MTRYNRSTANSSAILLSIFKELKKEFNIDDSKKLKSVAVRAAFYSTMYTTNGFTLSDIGSVAGVDHATVLWGVKRCSYGFYDKVSGFVEAVEFCTNMFNSMDEKDAIAFNEESGRAKYHKNKAMSLRSDNIRITRRLNHANSVVLTMTTNADKARRLAKTLKKEISSSNGYLKTLGLPMIDSSLVELIEECVQPIREEYSYV